MTRSVQSKRPNCEEILEKKTSWALSEEEFEVNEELKRVKIPKLDDENQIVFSLLESKLYEINDENKFKKRIYSKESKNEISDKAIKSKSKRVHNCVIN